MDHLHDILEFIKNSENKDQENDEKVQEDEEDILCVDECSDNNEDDEDDEDDDEDEDEDENQNEKELTDNEDGIYDDILNEFFKGRFLKIYHI